jgi:hypothetical protein
MTETPSATDFQFTYEDFEGLIDALSKMAIGLPKGQWGLLLSIFAAAAGHVEVSEAKPEGKFSGVRVKDGKVIEDPRGKEVRALREQLQKAYMPGRPPNSIGFMVSPPKSPPQPPPPPPPSA